MDYVLITVHCLRQGDHRELWHERSVKKNEPLRRQERGARLRRRRLLVYGARRAILADLRNRLHQMGVDKRIILSIADNAHRILPVLNFFHLAEHHFTQKNDAAIGTR